MDMLLNLMPLAAFLLAYRVGGIYPATAVLMAAMGLLALVDYLRFRRIPPLHLLSTLLVLMFGSATLLLHDPRFLKVKPTILLWLIAGAFVGSQWFGEAPFAQRMLQPTLPAGVQVTRQRWLRINWLWAGAFVAFGGANLCVARFASEQAWVYFKVFGLTIGILVLTVAQTLWLQRQAPA